MAKRNPNIFNDDFETPAEYKPYFNDPYRLKHPSDIRTCPTHYIKDYNINKNKKRYSNPYFSSDTGGWEIDFMVLLMWRETALKTFANWKENLKNADEGNSNFYYLLVININTKYLHVFPSFSKDEKTVIASVSELLENNTLIKSVGGDYDAAFVNGVEVFLSQNNIKYFFSPYKHTNRNRVVDRVIRTIRNLFFNLGTKVSLFHVELMQKIVHFYNNCIHRSLFNRFTPNQARNNYIIERTFIQEKNKQLEKARKASLNYVPESTPRNILLVNVPNKDRMQTEL
jgi:hypothetical protein